MNHGSNQFIPWLRNQLDSNAFTGCRWVEKDQDTFKIAWPRAAADVDAETSLGVMHAWYTHKFGDSRLGIQPTAVKGNFRSCLNSKKREIAPIREYKEANITWKIMRFTKLPPDDKKKRREEAHMRNRQLPNGNMNRHPSGADDPRARVHSNENTETCTPPHYMNPNSPYIPVQGGPTYSPYHGPGIYNNQSNESLPGGTGSPYQEFSSNPVSPQPPEPIMVPYGWYPEWFAHQQILKNKKTALEVQVFNKGKLVDKQQFTAMEGKQLHVYFDRRKQDKLWEPVPEGCEEYPVTFRVTTDRMKAITRHFNPGVLINCDQFANISLKRMSPGHIYYSNGRESKWIKLEKPGQQSRTDQHVFGFTEYLFVGESYAGNLEHHLKQPGFTPELQLLSSEILLTIAEEPQPGMGFNDCDLGIKIIHSKAEEYFQYRIKPLLPSDGPELKLSDDLAAMTLDDEPSDYQEAVQYAWLPEKIEDMEQSLDLVETLARFVNNEPIVNLHDIDAIDGLSGEPLLTFDDVL